MDERGETSTGRYRWATLTTSNDGRWFEQNGLIASKSDQNPSTSPSLSWRPPHPTLIKANMAIFHSDETDRVVAAYVVRDSKGHLILAGARSLSAHGDFLIPAAWWYMVHQIASRYHGPVVFETVQWHSIRDHWRNPELHSSSQTFARRLHTLISQNFSKWHVHCVPSLQNQVAALLSECSIAKLDRTGANTLNWTKSLPIKAAQQLLLEIPQ